MEDRERSRRLRDADASPAAQGTSATREDDPIFEGVRRIVAASPAIRLAIPVMLLGLVTALDGATGTELSFTIFYLAPVVSAGVLVSRGAGRLMALLSAGIWGYLDVTTGRGYSATWMQYWNIVEGLGLFLLVGELLSRLWQAHSRVRELSRTDSLTGIANARVFEEHAERVIAESRRNGRPFTIVYLDLDRFKLVNDRAGHREGDRLLRAVARLIGLSLRTTDVAARLGGDEFGILMPDTDAIQAVVSLDRIGEALAAEVESHWAVAASFGAMTFNEPPADVDFAIRHADALMYRAKAEGRGRIVQATWPEAEEAARVAQR